MMMLALAFASLGQPEPGALTLAQVLELHQQYLDRIHTIDAEVETWQSKDGGKTWTLTGRDHWFKDGPRERHQSWASGVQDKAGKQRKNPFWLDDSFSPSESRRLMGWNPDSPPEPPSPANHFHGASANIGKPSNHGTISTGPPALLMLAPTLTEYLPAAVRQASHASMEKTDLEGKVYWLVRFDKKVGLPAEYRVFLDQDHGFAIARVEVKSKTAKPAEGISDVVAYHEAEPGLFIPFRMRTSASSLPGTIIERRVTRLIINEPITEDKLTVRFPQGIEVQDTRSGSKPIYHIWDADGPKLTFDSPEQRRAYKGNFFKQKPQGSSSLGWFLGATAILFAAVIVLVLVRRRLAPTA